MLRVHCKAARRTASSMMRSGTIRIYEPAGYFLHHFVLKASYSASERAFLKPNSDHLNLCFEMSPCSNTAPLFIEFFARKERKRPDFKWLLVCDLREQVQADIAGRYAFLALSMSQLVMGGFSSTATRPPLELSCRALTSRVRKKNAYPSQELQTRAAQFFWRVSLPRASDCNRASLKPHWDDLNLCLEISPRSARKAPALIELFCHKKSNTLDWTSSGFWPMA